MAIGTIGKAGGVAPDLPQDVALWGSRVKDWRARTVLDSVTLAGWLHQERGINLVEVQE